MDKWNFLVIPNGNDRTTNPAHKLFARQRHSVAANTSVELQFRRCRRHLPSVSAPPLTWSLWKGSIDENPSHRGLGFVRVQFAGASWMYLPMRQWADVTPLQPLDIAPPCMGICGPVAPSIAPINPPRIPWAQHPADRPRFATSSEIAAGNRSADNFELGTDEPAHNKGATIMLKSLMLAVACAYINPPGLEPNAPVVQATVPEILKQAYAMEPGTQKEIIIDHGDACAARL